MKAKTLILSLFVFVFISFAAFAEDANTVNVIEDGDGIIEAGEDKMLELQRATQNPVADLISLPFQNNTNFHTGPKGKTQNVLNIQPVIPFRLNKDWNLITRTIIPVINQPSFYDGIDRTCGIGNVNFSAFLSPVDYGKTIWGIGPAFEFPTHTDKRLGSDNWSVGPSFAALQMKGPWVYGGLISQLWSVAGDDPEVNKMLFQPFINYNLPDGWSLNSSPIITANWAADSGNQWTIPIGGGISKLAQIGNQPVSFSIGAYYNIEKPRNGEDWSLRASISFLFPK